MKENSIRLRLTPLEVKKIKVGEPIQEFVLFGPDSSLTYCLESAKVGEAIHARFDGKAVRIFVPEKILSEWNYSEVISLNNKNSVTADRPLSISIERDLLD